MRDAEYTDRGSLLESYAFYFFAGLGALPAAFLYGYLDTIHAKPLALTGALALGLVLGLLAWPAAKRLLIPRMADSTKEPVRAHPVQEDSYTGGNSLLVHGLSSSQLILVGAATFVWIFLGLLLIQIFKPPTVDF